MEFGGQTISTKIYKVEYNLKSQNKIFLNKNFKKRISLYIIFFDLSTTTTTIIIYLVKSDKVGSGKSKCTQTLLVLHRDI